MSKKGLVIRFFMGGYYLCDGQPPAGCENNGELYLGNTVKWFETWNEANEMRSMINGAFGQEEMNFSNKGLSQNTEI